MRKRILSSTGASSSGSASTRPDLNEMAYLPNAPFRRPRGWIMAMNWDDLLFMHWCVDPAALRPHLPSGLELETFDGKAWLGVVPFRMAGVRPRFIPRIP